MSCQTEVTVVSKRCLYALARRIHVEYGFLCAPMERPLAPGPKSRGLEENYLMARISGVAKALANWMEIVAPLRTLFTSAGLKQAMHVPALCRTLG